MRKRKYFHLLQCLCLELNRLLELLPSVFSFSTSACSMCWFLCPHHVVSGEGAIYPQHTELQIEHPSLITDAQVAMLFFSLPCCIFTPVWICCCLWILHQGPTWFWYVQGSYMLSINYSFRGKMACGSCLQDNISCGLWKRKTLNLCGIFGYRCEA